MAFVVPLVFIGGSLAGFVLGLVNLIQQARLHQNSRQKEVMGSIALMCLSLLVGLISSIPLWKDNSPVIAHYWSIASERAGLYGQLTFNYVLKYPGDIFILTMVLLTAHATFSKVHLYRTMMLGAWALLAMMFVGTLPMTQEWFQAILALIAHIAAIDSTTKRWWLSVIFLAVIVIGFLLGLVSDRIKNPKRMETLAAVGVLMMFGGIASLVAFLITIVVAP